MTQADPRHLRVRELLLQCGGSARVPRLAGWLNQEGRCATEDAVRRWLAADQAAGLVTPDGDPRAHWTFWRWTAPEPPVRCDKPADVTR